MDGDWEDYAVEPACLGPLFEQAAEPGPFAESKIKPTPLEALVAGLIWRRKGRREPISIAEILRLSGVDGLSERKVKDVVEQLRTMHRMPIGASRQEPAGYFRIMDAADREAAVRPYREQIISMWRTLRVLDSQEKLRELHGQLRLGDE